MAFNQNKNVVFNFDHPKKMFLFIVSPTFLSSVLCIWNLFVISNWWLNVEFFFYPPNEWNNQIHFFEIYFLEFHCFLHNFLAYTQSIKTPPRTGTVTNFLINNYLKTFYIGKNNNKWQQLFLWAWIRVTLSHAAYRFELGLRPPDFLRGLSLVWRCRPQAHSPLESSDDSPSIPLLTTT